MEHDRLKHLRFMAQGLVVGMAQEVLERQTDTLPNERQASHTEEEEDVDVFFVKEYIFGALIFIFEIRSGSQRLTKIGSIFFK